MKPQALLLFLLVAAVVVVGWFAFRSQATVAPGAAGGPATPVADQPGETTQPVAADPAGQAPGGARPAAAAGDAARTAAPDVGSAGDAAPSSRIRGRIVDLQGSPRAGVKLSASFRPSFEDGGVDVADLIVPRGANGWPRSECTTGPDGTFQLRAPADKVGSLAVDDDDLVFRDRSPQLRGKAGDQELGDVVVVRGARLQGIVQDERGQPVGDVLVKAQLGPLGFDVQSESKTAADGTFSVGKLRSGTWTLRTESSRFMPNVEQFELAAEQQRTDLVIVVEQGRAIAGRVIDDRGVGVEGIKVGCRRQEALGGVDLNRFSAGEATTTAADGSFSLAGLNEDKATVRAFGPGHTSVTARDVPVGTSNLELRVQRYGIVEGVLVASDGTPIPGSRISAVNADGRRDNGMMLVDDMVDMPLVDGISGARTDENGRFEMLEVRPGMVTVRARGKTHRPTSQSGVTVRPAQRVEGLRLVANIGAIARIHVVDADGKAVAGAKVRVEKAPEPRTGGREILMRSVAVGDMPGDIAITGGGALGTGETDDQGIALVMGLPAGDVVLQAKHSDFAPAQAVQVSLPVSGTVDGKLVLREPGYLDVQVTRGDGSAAAATHVVLESAAGGGDEKAVTDAEGMAHFGPLASGEYTAVLSLGPRERNVGAMTMTIGGEQDTIRSSAKTVVVLAGKTVSVDLLYPILTRFTGRVLGVDGPVSGCLVELDTAEEGEGLPGLGGRTAKTDEDGAFSFDDVESGEYVVRYGRSTQIVKASLELEVAPNTPELHRELALRTGTVRVRLQAKDDAEPIERAEVTLQRAGASSGKRGAPQRVMMFAVATVDNSSGETSTMTFGNERTLSDGDGEAVIEDVPVGEYTLRVEHRKYAPVSKEDVIVVERQATDCGLIEMAAAGQVRGKVLNGAGERVPMAMVERRDLGSEEWSEREVAMDGAYRLTGLEPGKYELRAQSLGANAGEPGEPVEVEVEAGRTKVVDLTVK